MSSLVNISAPSLREEAARVIRAAIMSGEIAAGEIYSVPAISTRLGVSATPVREAMLDLVSEGLVTPIRNRGFRVVSLSAHDLEGINRLRMLLEVPTTGDVAVEHDDADIPRFRALAEELPKHVEAGDIQAYLDADRNFHLGLLALLGNERLIDIVGMLRNQIRLSIGRLASSGKLMESALQHAEIVAAIEARDRTRTEELMRDHLEHLRFAWADEDDSTPGA
jgi:DNA-binding GntR family transcriptional regulator